MTTIEWTQQTWNPTSGCDRISPGCTNCYALTMAKRLKGMGQAKYQTDGNPKTSGPGFGIAVHPEAIREPLRWKKPRLVFVNSMSDLFHAGIPTADLHLIFGVMAATPQHTYQVLTKRHGRMRSLLNDPQFAHMVRHRAEQVFGRPATASWTWPLPNVHLGVSVENQKWADIRIPALIDTPAAVRFLSMEPLLGPVDIVKYLGDAHGIEESRGRRVLGGSGRRADHRQPGPGLESGCTQERPLERRDEDDSLRAQESRERYRLVPTGTRHEGQHPLSGPGTQTGVAVLRGADTAGSDGEPQERQQAGQPSGEPGTGDALGAGSARPASAEAGTPGSARDAQRDGEADARRGSADQAQAFSRRNAGVDCRGLPDQHATRLANRQGYASISWVICGGESGPGARPCDPGWIEDIVTDCQTAGTAVFVKQLGSVWARDTTYAGKSVAAHGDTKGGNPDYWPAHLRVREYPTARQAADA